MAFLVCRLRAGTYTDIEGNNGLAYEVSNLLRIDTSAPRVVSVAPQIDASPNSRLVIFDVTYSEPVFDVDTTDFMLIMQRVVQAAELVQLIMRGNNTYQITVTDINGNGSLRVDVLGGGYFDKVGNAGVAYSAGISHITRFALKLRIRVLLEGALQ